MAEKITIKSCIVERSGETKEGKPFTIYTVTDNNGGKYQSFEEFNESES